MGSELDRSILLTRCFKRHSQTKIDQVDKDMKTTGDQNNRCFRYTLEPESQKIENIPSF